MIGHHLHEHHRALLSGLTPAELQALAVGLTALARVLSSGSTEGNPTFLPDAGAGRDVPARQGSRRRDRPSWASSRTGNEWASSTLPMALEVAASVTVARGVRNGEVTVATTSRAAKLSTVA